MTHDILLERRGAIGLATLNRPLALNALTLPMIRAYWRRLDAWEHDPEVKAVVLRGAGERAFCAGGDIRAIHDAGKAGDRLTRDFFREEYALNHRIHAMAKPHVALIDGITMGGGVGLSVHGSHRIATERTLFAMPETGIGLFPDVGGGYFLPRCPGETGMYLALTGARLKAADALHCGVATHAVAGAEIAALIEALAGADYGRNAHGAVNRVLAGFTVAAGEAPIAPHRATIDRCFAAGSVEAILDALTADGSAGDHSEWARQQRAVILTKSPTSLKITHRQLRAAAFMSLAEDLTMEYRLTQACIAGHDFYEGVRAIVIEKDNAPKWRPATLGEVDDAAVERHFAPPKDGDLQIG
ncbi:MAG: enoyl-CoA hydratase/isomerase family protein [Alphaproteobacteria bacterium]|nr:enoyl-CoA hydratase/isomerase family protein [Alphaproteobacteria bacterium]